MRGFDATVDVLFDGRKASIASVVGLLGLGAGEGATVELVGRGAHAQQAVDAVEHERCAKHTAKSRKSRHG